MENHERKQRHKPVRRHANYGNLAALRRRLWRAFCDAQDISDLEEIPPELRLKAISTMATTAGIYLKILVGEPAEETPEADVTRSLLLVKVKEGTNGHPA